jgi:hypothetical protein
MEHMPKELSDALDRLEGFTVALHNCVHDFVSARRVRVKPGEPEPMVSLALGKTWRALDEVNGAKRDIMKHLG